MCPAVPGAQADQRDKGGVTPLGVLPPALRPEVERLMLRVREERELARIPSRGGASNMDPGAAAAVDPIGDAAADPGDAAVDLASGHDHDKPGGSQLQPGSQEGGACSLEDSPGYPPAEGGGSSGRAGSVRVCAGCWAKLQACGRCMSVRYCSAECQAKHWREGGHKEACPRLRDIRVRRKATGG